MNGIRFDSSSAIIKYSEEHLPEGVLFFKSWFNDKELLEVMTSGSTGEPKSIELKKRHMENSAKATGDYFDLKAGTTALLCMPIEYIAGKMMLVRALVLGWELDIVAPSANPLTELNKKYHFSAMVPLQVQNSLNKIQLIEKLIVGGGSVSKELSSKLQNVSSQIFETYGMTETITHIAIRPINAEQKNKSESSSFFETLPGVSIQTDANGCLIIIAPHISENSIITNDLVQITSDTTFEWLGRNDSVINSGGLKLIPEQIEKKLNTLVSARFFVAGLPDINLGEKLVLIVEGDDENKNIIGSLKAQQILGKYEIPKEVYFLKRFVSTNTGKIRRKETLKLLPLDS